MAITVPNHLPVTAATPLRVTQVRPLHSASVCCRSWGIAVCAFALVTPHQAPAQQASDDATVACGRAATQAEHDWRLPISLLTAIGIVESGRRRPTASLPIIWPWTINAEGRGFYLQSKAAAVNMVHYLQLHGVSVIDVGCFQVDLYYHPHSFASLEEAFDPDANARAAARILSLGRLGSTGWYGAIATYHSASPLIGAAYAQKVRSVWPWARAHPSWSPPDVPTAYAILLSTQARLVRVVTPADPLPAQSMGLPRVISANPLGHTDRTEAFVQWMHRPVENLPYVLSPDDATSPLVQAMGDPRGDRLPHW
jgi:hypothetical protein